GVRVPLLEDQTPAGARRPPADLHPPVETVASGRDGQGQADHPDRPESDARPVLHRLNPVLRGWCAYFRHGVSSRTFNYLRAYSWRRVTIWLRHKHHGRNWRWLRHRYLPGWWPTAETVGLYNPGAVKIYRYRYRYRGSRSPP